MKLTANPAWLSLPPNRGKGSGAKFLRIMKLTTIIILAACLHTSAKGVAQQTITFSGKEVSLEYVFNAIKKQTNYRFFFNTDMLTNASKVTLDVKNAQVEQVMNMALKDQPLTFTIKGRTIFVMKKVEEEKKSVQVERTGDPITVSGRVTDENGEPLAGANVKVKGSNNGITTDNQGRFTLSNVDPNASLEISFVGRETEILSVKGKTVFSVALGQKVGTLDETVVIAYGITTKRFNTGNVSSVKSEDIQKQPVNNPLLALQGRVPGMVISQVNGLAGGGVQVQIRGQNSIANGSLPLYIVDGVPYNNENLPNLGGFILGSSSNAGDRGGNPLNFINPLDIESVDVLKDADATAIYGSRGANGVVLITTKKGKSGKMKFDVNTQIGFGQVAHMVDLLNVRQYLDMRYEALRNDGLVAQSTDYDLTVWDTTKNANWQKELIGGTAKYTDVQASLSGGTGNLSFLVSGNYHKETTVFPGDFKNQRGSMHFNLNASSSNQKLKFILSNNYSANDNRILTFDLTSIALTIAPNAPDIYNPDGTFNWANATWVNPLAGFINTKYKSKTNNLVSNATLSYEILRGLDLKTSFGYTNIQTNETTSDPATSKDQIYWSQYGTSLRNSSFINNRATSWIIEPQINYTTNLFKGSLSILIGTTVQQNNSNGERLDAEGFNSDLVIENPQFASIVKQSNYLASVYKYNALFSRLNYNLKDKYLFNLTARRDGSSRFGPAKQFHNFGAIGIGWIFSKEKVVIDNLKFLSFGKLRASFGTTGSDQIGDYSFFDLYNPTNAVVLYQGSNGLQLTRHYTPDLAWEETRKIEGGVEIGILKDRIVTTISHYYNTSANQLVSYILPSTTGFTTITRNLDATVKNIGWEVTLNTINLNSKRLKWNSSFNIFWNRNELSSVDSGMSIAYKRLKGKPLGSKYVYKYAGVNATTGLYEVLDSQGSVVQNPSSTNDRTVLTKRMPIISGGFQNNFQFKNFELSFFIHFVKQKGMNYLYNYLPGYWSSIFYGNQPVSVLDRWQKPGDNSNIQKFNQDFNAYPAFENAQNSDQLYTDISYVRLKNVSFSWQVPNNWKQNVHLQYCRIYVQGQNLLTFTNYKGLDPENHSITSLPPLRVITAGIQFGL